MRTRITTCMSVSLDGDVKWHVYNNNGEIVVSCVSTGTSISLGGPDSGLNAILQCIQSVTGTPSPGPLPSHRPSSRGNTADHAAPLRRESNHGVSDNYEDDDEDLSDDYDEDLSDDYDADLSSEHADYLLDEYAFDLEATPRQDPPAEESNYNIDPDTGIHMKNEGRKRALARLKALSAGRG